MPKAVMALRGRRALSALSAKRTLLASVAVGPGGDGEARVSLRRIEIGVVVGAALCAPSQGGGLVPESPPLAVRARETAG